jgi:hypothetical protein
VSTSIEIQLATNISVDDATAALLRQGADGKADVYRLRALFRKNPALAEEWGSLPLLTALLTLQKLFGDNLSIREAALARLRQTRAALLGDRPTALEGVLVERVLSTWLQAQEADLREANQPGETLIARAEHLQRRQERAHRRFVGACRALAPVRGMALPAVLAQVGQVNVAAGPQVNVAG